MQKEPEMLVDNELQRLCEHNHLTILAFLQTNESFASQIADKCGVSRSRVHVLLHELQDMGLIKVSKYDMSASKKVLCFKATTQGLTIKIINGKCEVTIDKETA